MTRQPRLTETQPQQGQRPQSPLNYDQSQGKSLVVTSPQGERIQATIGPYHGVENGFEVRLNMGGGYQDGLSVHLQRQGWQIPKIAPPVNQRSSVLQKMAGRTRHESAERIVQHLLDR